MCATRFRDKSLRARVKRFFGFFTYSTALGTCDTTEYRESYVYFRSSKLIWIDFLLKKRFNHCGVLYNTPNGIICIDFKINRLDVGYAKDSDIDKFIKKLKRSKATILKGKTNAPHVVSNRFPYSIAPSNCVSVTKQLLGIKKAMVYTPHKLYKTLLKHYNFKEI